MRSSLLLLLFVSCTVSEPAPVSGTVPPYDRSEWGRWKDADKDCQDTRQEVLLRSATGVPLLNDKGCRVLPSPWSFWIDPLTGDVLTNPRGIDIDHLVPLKEAHVSGGHAWSKARKSAYNNDLSPGHLQAVSASANRSKGAKQPHEWLPPKESARCNYVRSWIKVKLAWGLTMDCEEAQLLHALEGTYCGD
jgi:hypothetical protein